MRKLFALAAALCATIALPACAQPAPAAKDADPALWVVSDEDTTIYLFGTVHVLKPGLSWFDEAVKTAFDKSNTLVLEMVEPGEAEQQRVIVAKAIDADGPPLTQKLSESDRAAYVKAMGEIGVPTANFEPFKPWMAAISLAILPLQKLGYDPNSGAEKVLSAAAKTAGKEVTGLETFEQQIGFFDSLPEDQQIKYLNSTVQDLPKFGETMDKMVTEWTEGDADALGALMNEGMKETPEIAEVLLYQRNARWATWIAERMKQPGTVFVAVGAGHLAGDKSVIADLKTHKLTARRVRY